VLTKIAWRNGGYYAVCGDITLKHPGVTTERFVKTVLNYRATTISREFCKRFNRAARFSG
jgi:hypothetical protein